MSNTGDHISTLRIDTSERSGLLDSYALMSRYQSVILPHRLEDTELQPQELIKHTILFYKHYHNDFPILPGIHYFLQNIQASPLLVWVIVAITSTRLPLQENLRVKLIEPIKRLAGTSIMGGESPSVFLVQALLLLCNWPMPFKATVTDPSWTYCGAAVSIALRIGLHQPDCHVDFMYGSADDEDEIALRTRSWVACFIMQHRVSIMLGLPTMIKLDYTILESMKSHSSRLPESLQRMLFLTYKIHNFSNQLGQCEFAKYGLSQNPLSLVQGFERDLDLFQKTLESKREETAALAAKLHLYSYLLSPSLHENDSIGSLNLVEGHHITYYVGQAYSCASRIVNLSHDMFYQDPGIETMEGIQDRRLWNVGWTHDLMYAMMVLLWIVKLSEVDCDIDAADAILRQGRNIYKQLTAMDDDHFSRLCDLVDYITSMDFNNLKDSRTAMKQSVIRSRMSANIIWNVVYAAKKRFFEQRRDPGGTELNSADMALLSTDPLSLDNAEASTYMNDLTEYNLAWIDWDSFLPTDGGHIF